MLWVENYAHASCHVEMGAQSTQGMGLYLQTASGLALPRVKVGWWVWSDLMLSVKALRWNSTTLSWLRRAYPPSSIWTGQGMVKLVSSHASKWKQTVTAKIIKNNPNSSYGVHDAATNRTLSRFQWKWWSEHLMKDWNMWKMSPRLRSKTIIEQNGPLWTINV
jgi:hypothetical protein